MFPGLVYMHGAMQIELCEILEKYHSHHNKCEICRWVCPCITLLGADLGTTKFLLCRSHRGLFCSPLWHCMLGLGTTSDSLSVWWWGFSFLALVWTANYLPSISMKIGVLCDDGIGKSACTSTDWGYAHGSGPQLHTVSGTVCSRGLVLVGVGNHRWPMRNCRWWRNRPTELHFHKSCVIRSRITHN